MFAAAIYIVLAVTIISLFDVVSTNRISFRHCQEYSCDIPGYAWKGKAALLWGKCIIVSKIGDSWGTANNSCIDYADGHLISLETPEKMTQFNNTVMNDWHGSLGWLLIILKGPSGHPDFAFSPGSKTGETYIGPDRKCGFVCEYPIGPSYTVGKAECLQNENHMAGKKQRNAVVGNYCFRSSKNRKNWNQSRYSCDEYLHGHMITVNTQAKTDEFRESMKKWGATYKDPWIYWVLQGTTPLKHPAYNYKTGFFDGKQAIYNYVCQYTIKDNICKKYAACEERWENSELNEMCVCPEMQVCRSLSWFRYDMHGYYAAGFSKIFAAADFYLGYRTQLDKTVSIITGSCVDHIL